jgi:triacylglycerol esterase/lipase EstA (alpha/beta hydrolase family)
MLMRPDLDENAAMALRPRRVIVVALSVALLLGSVSVAGAEPPGPQPGDGGALAGANDWNCTPSAAHPRPVVLVHGLLATAPENWSYVSPRLRDAGYCVFALTYGERPDLPYFGGILPMEESAQELDTFVERVLAATGAAKVDLVGHSEGTVMPQWWLKFLGGAAVTDHYVAITPIYQGTTLAGSDILLQAGRSASPGVLAAFLQGLRLVCGSCDSFVRGSDFLRTLYGDGVYAIPGVTYTTIMTKFDELVVPYTSGYLDSPAATNIVLQDVCPLDLSEHAAVAFDPVVMQMILNALDPSTARAPKCGAVLGVQLGSLGL